LIYTFIIWACLNGHCLTHYATVESCDLSYHQLAALIPKGYHAACMWTPELVQ